MYGFAGNTNIEKTKDGVVVGDPGGAASPFARDRDLPSGGGGLVSSARDYARFNAMLTNEGELDGRRVLKAETVRLARSNLMPPGVAFDARGNRLGRGGGFYDRTFARAAAGPVLCGAALELQLVDEVPHGPGDRAMDLLVTECAVRRTGEARRGA